MNYNFTESYISNINFLDYEFIDCNLSMVKAKNATKKEVIFNNCKLVGLPFQDYTPNLISIHFIKSELYLFSFNNLKIKATTFDTCKLEQTDFTNTDLSTNPEQNRLKNAQFSKENAIRLLTHFQIDIN
ncbi:pentapeptide repeat-containing protein [Formosa sp. Hel1_31_208]|uniref:pentapeptide repeat-containing protein n=1 Tax=Formosa sp. Hel1_31_208 TaxID=1798225 RepID=UPI0021010307|nr:pentapeptide repeat-containing protein [Formosa sp. Hel1_31_208]